MGKIASKKVEIDGHLFDSLTEAQYYEYLKTRGDVRDIILQPQIELLEKFNVVCRECSGLGKVKSEKTGNLIKCKRCNGTGEKTRQSWTYKADFRIVYVSGKVEFIDVKGFANERFPLVKKMFEYQTGAELIVVKKKGKGWIRV